MNYPPPPAPSVRSQLCNSLETDWGGPGGQRRRVRVASKYIHYGQHPITSIRCSGITLSALVFKCEVPGKCTRNLNEQKPAPKPRPLGRRVSHPTLSPSISLSLALVSPHNSSWSGKWDFSASRCVSESVDQGNPTPPTSLTPPPAACPPLCRTAHL